MVAPQWKNNEKWQMEAPSLGILVGTGTEPAPSEAPLAHLLSEHVSKFIT